MRYNTKQYIRSLLEAAEKCEDLERVEEVVVERLDRWFRTFSGWGLLSR